MANIYQEQAQSDIYNQSYFAQGNPSKHVAEYSQEAKEKSDEYLQKARNIYSDAVSLQGQSALNELASNPELSTNPEKLGVEIDKIIGKMSSEIVDDEIKANFLAKSAISKSSYLNNAYAKALKVEEEKTKSTIFNKIYSDIDTIGLAFSNGMQGVSTEADVQNAVLADVDLTNKINALNSDGTFVFPDETRRKFELDRDNAILTAFKTSFDGMTDEQKKKALSDIENDKMIVGSFEDKENKRVVVNLKDVVSPKTYSDFKTFTKKERNAETQKIKKQFEEMRLAKKVEEYETEKMLSTRLVDLPTDQQLAVLRKNEHLVSPEYYKSKEESILSSKGINAESRADVARELTLAVESVLRSDDEGLDFLKNADKVLIRIEQDYANGRLSTSDKKRLLGMIDRGIVHEMPKLENEWFTFGFEYKDAYDFFLDNLSDQTMADTVFMKYLRKRESGEYSGEQKKALAVSMAKAANDGELYIKTYKNMAELNADIEAGLVSEGESVYVAGEKGTVQGTLSNNKK